MALSPKTVKIRQQIINEVKNGNISPVADIMALFDMTRPAVMRHINALIKQGKLEAVGTTKARFYKLGQFREQAFSFVIEKGVSDEHLIYTNNFAWLFDNVPENISEIIFYGFTEMVNNAIDHSDGKICTIKAFRDANSAMILIEDDGEGIFKRVTRLCNLPDIHQSIIELKAGKLTTDPDNHSGQGIFFTSKVFSSFFIESTGLRFIGSNSGDKSDVFCDTEEQSTSSTQVVMAIDFNSTSTLKEVFDRFSNTNDEDFPFNKTIIPVTLAKLGNEQLVSRSQAKRLLTRVENFEFVIFDFKGVETIGQAFADEIFRVKARTVPNIQFIPSNANEDVMNMINRAKNS